MSNPQEQSTKVVTGRCRASYLNVFKPRINTLKNPPEEEFSVVLLIPKSDHGTVGKIRDAIKVAIAKKWGDKPPSGLKMPLRDGDAEKPDQAAYKGHYFLNVKSKEQPGIVDASRAPILDHKQFVSGDYCIAAVNGFAYETREKNIVVSKGVSFGLNNIMMLEKGEPLTSRASAEDDFKDVDTSAMDNSDI